MDAIRRRSLRFIDRTILAGLNAGKIFGFLGSGRESVEIDDASSEPTVRFPNLSDEGWPGFTVPLPLGANFQYAAAGPLTRIALWLVVESREDIATNLESRPAARSELLGRGFRSNVLLDSAAPRMTPLKRRPVGPVSGVYMKLVAISVGRPREVQWRGRSVRTSIFKTPVSRRVRVARDNVEGDEQSDLSVHGGPEKAVYAYPAEHYPFWHRELPDAEFHWGAFGENFTTEGLLEDEVCIGDRYRVGTAELVVTQPRMPCYKLGIRFERPDMVKRFHQSGRSGFYLAVEREGEVGPEDAIERLERGAPRLLVAEVVALYARDAANQPLLERASHHPSLPAAWRDYFRQRLWQPDA